MIPTGGVLITAGHHDFGHREHHHFVGGIHRP